MTAEGWSTYGKRGGKPDEFDVEKINAAYALVMVGGRTVILEENGKLGDATPIPDRIRFIAPEAFNHWFANQVYDKGDKPVSAAQLWLRHPKRRQYRGIVFDPSAPPAGASGGYYNLWQGFSYEPVQPSSRNSCSRYFDHLRVNVANGNEGHAAFIIGNLSKIVKRPTERAGISLVLRGKQGTGKTVVGLHLGRLFEANYALVDNPRYIVGNFNAHLASLLLLQADEGFWAGDKQAEGILKGMVTSDRQFIEMKGKDPIQVKNYVHLMVTSNSQWVVPAGNEERRFAIFDVAEHSMQNREYFAEMEQELVNGGYQALLWELLHYDPGAIDIRSIPRTEALLDQKIASLPPVDKWWFTCLWRGWITRRQPGPGDADDAAQEERWPAEIECEAVHSSYINFCERHGHRHPLESPGLGRELFKMVVGLSRRRPQKSGLRYWVYRLPALEACRDAFDSRLGSKFDWEGGATSGTSIDEEAL